MACSTVSARFVNICASVLVIDALGHEDQVRTVDAAGIHPRLGGTLGILLPLKPVDYILRATRRCYVVVEALRSKPIAAFRG